MPVNRGRPPFQSLGQLVGANPTQARRLGTRVAKRADTATLRHRRSWMAKDAKKKESKKKKSNPTPKPKPEPNAPRPFLLGPPKR